MRMRMSVKSRRGTFYQGRWTDAGEVSDEEIAKLEGLCTQITTAENEPFSLVLNDGSTAYMSTKGIESIIIELAEDSGEATR